MRKVCNRFAGLVSMLVLALMSCIVQPSQARGDYIVAMDGDVIQALEALGPQVRTYQTKDDDTGGVVIDQYAFQCVKGQPVVMLNGQIVTNRTEIKLVGNTLVFSTEATTTEEGFWATFQLDGDSNPPTTTANKCKCFGNTKKANKKMCSKENCDTAGTSCKISEGATGSGTCRWTGSQVIQRDVGPFDFDWDQMLNAEDPQKWQLHANRIVDHLMITAK